jgi:glycine cleavage system H protein
VSGTITEVNEALRKEPSLINKSPYEKGWMVKLKLSSEAELKGLMDEAAYNKHCETSGH